MEDARRRVAALAAKRAAAVAAQPPVAPPLALQGATLRAYQLQGVAWLLHNYDQGINGVLADEMGLGKTLQTIAFLLLLQERTPTARAPFLVVCPLSLVENWRSELERFAPSLGTLVYVGDKDARAVLRDEIADFVNRLPAAEQADPPFKFKVVVTTYETCNSDFEFLRQFQWRYLVVDEAARLKNGEGLLYETLRTLKIPRCCLLTGTPVQNNLKELHALLAFGMPTLFGSRDTFVKYFAAIGDAPQPARPASGPASMAASGPASGAGAVDVAPALSRMSEMHELLRPFLLRRVKEDVLGDLPPKREITVYAELTPLQKHLYRALLLKDLAAFESQQKKGLNNLLMQLRKCVNHPYLFDGVEPEPFNLGEHLVHVSGKLVVLDRLLALLRRRGSRVLIFSQMTRVLDILQDYLQLRQYKYERLDGSVRGEERNLAVKNFTADTATFVFLLSTRAGGVGLNLIASDTVIFMDSDFNPQADLQAAGRVHRIGQTKPVTIIRMLCRDTVEDVIMRRAAHKLRLSQAVMAATDTGGSGSADARQQPTVAELISALKFGLHKLMDSADDPKDAAAGDANVLRRRAAAMTVAPGAAELAALDRDLERTLNGLPAATDEPADAAAGGAGASTAAAAVDNDDTDEDDVGSAGGAKSIYDFNGTNYKPQARKQQADLDQTALDRLLAHARATDPAMAAVRKPVKVLTPEERQARAELAARRAEERRVDMERQRQAAARERNERRQQAWAEAGYVSAALPAPLATPVPDDEDADDVGDADAADDLDADAGAKLSFVDGDVTRPVRSPAQPAGPVVIVHLVDTSGRWGRGGVFSAIDRLDAAVGVRYEAAGEVDDLHLGDVHLIELTAGAHPRDAVALVVAQARDRSGQLTAVQLPSLETALEKISLHARASRATVHLPRIGQRSPGFDWYRTERCIRKCLTARGVPTFIYYYIRRGGGGGASDLPPAPARTTPAGAPAGAAAAASAAVDADATDEDDKNEGDSDTDAATESAGTPPPRSPTTTAGRRDAAMSTDDVGGSATDLDDTPATLPADAGDDLADDLFADLADVGSPEAAAGGSTLLDDPGSPVPPPPPPPAPAAAAKRPASAMADVDELATQVDMAATQVDTAATQVDDELTVPQQPPPTSRARMDVDEDALPIPAATAAAGPVPAMLDLFSGCQMWFAEPEPMLVRLATFYDADVMTDFDPDLTTHVIVPDDPAAAAMAIEARRADGALPARVDPALPFVRSSWIRDCATAGRLVAVSAYRLA